MQIYNNFNNYDRTSFVGVSDYKKVVEASRKMRQRYQECKYPGKVPKTSTLEPELLLDYLKARLGEQFKWYILSLQPKKVKKLLAEAERNFRHELSMIKVNLFQQEHAVSNPSQKRILINRANQVNAYIIQSLKVDPKPHRLHRLH